MTCFRNGTRAARRIPRDLWRVMQRKLKLLDTAGRLEDLLVRRAIAWLNEIVLGKRGITADTALRLGRFLKTSPQIWMGLQADWDLHQAVRKARRAS